MAVPLHVKHAPQEPYLLSYRYVHYASRLRESNGEMFVIWLALFFFFFSFCWFDDYVFLLYPSIGEIMFLDSHMYRFVYNQSSIRGKFWSTALIDLLRANVTRGVCNQYGITCTFSNILHYRILYRHGLIPHSVRPKLQLHGDRDCTQSIDPQIHLMVAGRCKKAIILNFWEQDRLQSVLYICVLGNIR